MAGDEQMGRRQGDRQAAMDRTAVLAAGRRARRHVCRRTVRASALCRHRRARRSRCSGRPYSFVNPPEDAPHEFYFNVLPEGSAVAAARRARAGRRRCGCSSAPMAFSACPRCRRRRRCGASPPAPASARSCRSCAPPIRGKNSSASCSCTRCATRRISRIATRSPRSRSATPDASPLFRSSAARPHRGALTGRIPDAIRDGRLEAWTGVPLTAENAHAMLCGNPDMVRDTQGVLESRGMRRHRRREPGHFTVETYW